jgi:hypothetical protein
MPTTASKLLGTLKLGDTSTGMALEAQISTIGVPQTITRDAPVLVLTGDVIVASAVRSYQITGTALLDLSIPSGIYYYVQTNIDQLMPFEFLPIGVTGPTWTGTLINDGWNTEELAAGALVISKFAWPVQGHPTITPPALAEL